MAATNAGAGPDTRDAPPSQYRPRRTNRVARLKAAVVGTPLPTDRLVHERLGKPTALAVFASDNLSSSAYATEEILRVLLLAGLGTAAFANVVPLTVVLLAVLAVLIFSYRQTIKAYPQAGGAYLVTRDNFGVFPAQVAGVSLLTDYILTVSVSVSAGTAALTSLSGDLYPYRVVISVGFIAVIAIGNLRGVRESGRLFAVPTYFFVAMMALLIGVGLLKLATGTLPEHASAFEIPAAAPPLGFAYVFLLLRAFASGGAAVTGVEAISNGVPAFKQPEWRNATTTLMWMGSLLGAMFLGLSVLAAHMHLGVDPHEKVTVLAQAGRAVFGANVVGNTLFAMLQIGTLLILVLAANTSFADFPRLASFHAHDHFLPHQLTRYGDRLVFSNGIIVLAGLASLLVVMFQASVTRLIPLYAIGVFTSFTFSQLGMARHHIVRREPGWRVGLAFNGLGGVVSLVMTLVIATVKFTEGAYLILIAMPLMLAGLLRVNKHYREAGESLRDPERLTYARDTPAQIVIIPVANPGRDVLYAAAYAARLGPLDVAMVHFAPRGTAANELVAIWGDYGLAIDFMLRRRRRLLDDLVAYVQSARAAAWSDAVINVLIPETVEHSGWRHVVHKWHIQHLKAALVREAGAVVTNVTHHPGYEALEPVTPAETPREATDGWRHITVVLVADVHNATLESLRYARSLGADELHCIHVAVDPDETDEVRRQWHLRELREELTVLDSPYRQIARPVHEWVQAVLDERPRTFVTIVISEFVVHKRWHSILHNQTALTLKGTFLFEPSVVVSAVPYRLDR